MRQNHEWNTYTYNKYLTLPVSYKIGDEMFGGIIVEIDESGYHGVIIADISFGVDLIWSTDYHNFKSWVSQDYNGKENSEMVLDYYSSISESAPAFEYCDNIVIFGYNDWYLPSFKELGMASRLLNLGGNRVPFWTSSEAPLTFAGEKAYRLIDTGTFQPSDKQSEAKVIPFREF